jgi:hypothetical protein
MAKKQTFADKVKKGQAGGEEKNVRLVVSYQSKSNNAWRFGGKMVRIPHQVNESQFIDEQGKKFRDELVARS